jgi:hypothetical protein
MILAPIARSGQALAPVGLKMSRFQDALRAIRRAWLAAEAADALIRSRPSSTQDSPHTEQDHW